MSKQEQYEAWADDYHHTHRREERLSARTTIDKKARWAFRHETIRASAPTHRAPVVHYTRT